MPLHAQNEPAPRSMAPLIRALIRPYHGWLAVILAAMVVETAMSLAGPWPLKIVLDNVVGHHHLPHWLARSARPALVVGHKMALAAAAAIGLVVIAALGALASYIDNYYTESVGQYVAQRPAHARLPPPRPALAVATTTRTRPAIC